MDILPIFFSKNPIFTGSWPVVQVSMYMYIPDLLLLLHLLAPAAQPGGDQSSKFFFAAGKFKLRDPGPGPVAGPGRRPVLLLSERSVSCSPWHPLPTAEQCGTVRPAGPGPLPSDPGPLRGLPGPETLPPDPGPGESEWARPSIKGRSQSPDIRVMVVSRRHGAPRAPHGSRSVVLA